MVRKTNNVVDNRRVRNSNRTVLVLIHLWWYFFLFLDFSSTAMINQYFVEPFQNPGKKRKRRHSSSARVLRPPEDLIEDCRRKEILISFQTAIKLIKNGDRTHTGDLLPISYIKNPLRQLQLVSSIHLNDHLRCRSTCSSDWWIFSFRAVSLAWDRCTRSQKIFWRRLSWIPGCRYVLEIRGS